MKSNKWGNTFRKYARVIHRDFSYFLSGMILIYAISGLVMNHRDSFNPDYSITRSTYAVSETLAPDNTISKETVLKMLEKLGEEGNYTKHYYPETGKMKVFLKGGSNLYVDFGKKEAVYEKLTRRPLLSALTRLHYNPGSWWTYFSDIFAAGLILITLTGILMIKGTKGLWGRGGIELLIGILIPILFLFS